MAKIGTNASENWNRRKSWKEVQKKLKNSWEKVEKSRKRKFERNCDFFLKVSTNKLQKSWEKVEK